MMMMMTMTPWWLLRWMRRRPRYSVVVEETIYKGTAVSAALEA